MDVPELNRVSGQVVDSALAVHSTLGPGLLESTYQACLAYELRKRGLQVREEVGLPVIYDTQRLEIGYRIDLLVQDVVVVEVKSVEAIAPIHRAQLLSYLKLSGKPIGLLLNFNVAPYEARDRSYEERMNFTAEGTEDTEKCSGFSALSVPSVGSCF